MPGEPFCEIGLNLKAKSSFPYIIVVDVTNDYIGYIPIEKVFREGEYEIRLARHSELNPIAVKLLVNEAEKLLYKISNY